MGSFLRAICGLLSIRRLLIFSLFIPLFVACAHSGPARNPASARDALGIQFHPGSFGVATCVEYWVPQGDPNLFLAAKRQLQSKHLQQGECPNERVVGVCKMKFGSDLESRFFGDVYYYSPNGSGSEGEVDCEMRIGQFHAAAIHPKLPREAQRLEDEFQTP